ncbi:MAG: HrpE/YscL family type III secretion apparatus protein [Puniceicoccales bacterium]|jgi:type III secretion protein L|nr:HrpE/YscL family type III secretion apparatus protein [Puniceicoccales bacterium]
MAGASSGSGAGIYQIQIDHVDLKQFGKVLKSKSYATLLDGRAVLSSAKSKCDEILLEASRRRDEIISAANRKAKEIEEEAVQSKKREEKRGYNDGVASGKHEISNVMMDFVTKSANSFSKLEKDVTEVVKMALRKIIGKIDKTELIVNVVKNSLQKIKLQKQATLKVAPSEAQILRDRIAEITEGNPVLQFLEVLADAHLQPGSCVIETELGVIDASVNVQLESIESALLKVKS